MKNVSRTIIAAAVATAVVLAIAGCSGGGASSPAEASAGSADDSSSSLFSNDGWPQNEITADVPAPEFSVKPSSVSSADAMVRLTYDNLPESEASAFVEAVKAAGFTYGAGEQKTASSYSYSARNTEDVSQSTNITIGYTSSGSLDVSVTNLKLM